MNLIGLKNKFEEMEKIWKEVLQNIKNNHLSLDLNEKKLLFLIDFNSDILKEIYNKEEGKNILEDFKEKKEKGKEKFLEWSTKLNKDSHFFSRLIKNSLSLMDKEIDILNSLITQIYSSDEKPTIESIVEYLLDQEVDFINLNPLLNHFGTSIKYDEDESHYQLDEKGIHLLHSLIKKYKDFDVYTLSLASGVKNNRIDYFFSRLTLDEVVSVSNLIIDYEEKFIHVDLVSNVFKKEDVANLNFHKGYLTQTHVIKKEWNILNTVERTDYVQNNIWDLMIKFLLKNCHKNKNELQNVNFHVESLLEKLNQLLVFE
jgi:hypothetical protein